MFRIVLWMLGISAGPGAGQAQTSGAAPLVGPWGLASCCQDKDTQRPRPRRAACAAPFTIRQDAGGTVMMYGPDDPASRPFVLQTSGGRTLLAAAGQGAPRGSDRELRMPEPGVVTLTFLDRAYASRHGAEVLVRCGRK